MDKEDRRDFLAFLIGAFLVWLGLWGWRMWEFAGFCSFWIVLAGLILMLLAAHV